MPSIRDEAPLVPRGASERQLTRFLAEVRVGLAPMPHRGTSGRNEGWCTLGIVHVHL